MNSDVLGIHVSMDGLEIPCQVAEGEADADKLTLTCSVCFNPLNTRTRGIFRISGGAGSKPVSDAAWTELFQGTFDVDCEDQLACRQCHRLLEEYGNIEADLLDCRKRILERFHSARTTAKVIFHREFEV